MHTQYEISQDQQVCVHVVGSDSEVHNLNVINRIEIEFLNFLMSTFLVHTQNEISQDQQVCVHGVGSDSELHNLHVVNRIENEFYIS